MLVNHDLEIQTAPYVVNGITYPASIEQSMTADQLAALGLYVCTDPGAPSDPMIQVTGSYPSRLPDGTIRLTYVVQPVSDAQRAAIQAQMATQWAQAQADAAAKAQAMAAANVPAPPAVPQTISRRQFFQQAANAGIITTDEAFAAVTTGAIPTILSNAIAAMPASDQFAAKMIIAGAATFERANPLTAEMGTALNMTSDQMDAFWTGAVKL